MRHPIAEALAEEMMRDKRVILFGEDVADYGGAFQVTSGFFATFGRERVFNTAISEACIAGSAVGMAMAGMRPVAKIMYIDFLPPRPRPGRQPGGKNPFYVRRQSEDPHGHPDHCGRWKRLRRPAFAEPGGGGDYVPRAEGSHAQ